MKGVVFKRCTQVIDPKTKRFSPLYNEDETITVPATRWSLPLARPSSGAAFSRRSVTFHHGNYPQADALAFQTDKDIFVGGDVLTGPKFVIDAIAAGHYAAESLHRRVQGGAKRPSAATATTTSSSTRTTFFIDSYDNAGRQERAWTPRVPTASAPRTARSRPSRWHRDQALPELRRLLLTPTSALAAASATRCCSTPSTSTAMLRDEPTCAWPRTRWQALRATQSSAYVKIVANSGSEAKIVREKAPSTTTHKEFNRTHPYTGNSSDESRGRTA